MAIDSTRSQEMWNALPKDIVVVADGTENKLGDVEFFVHFPEKEIEIKLDIDEEEKTELKEIILLIKNEMEKHGYEFFGEEADKIENFCIYYAANGKKAKLILKGGDNRRGFEVKQKTLLSDDGGILIKEEARSKIFERLDEAQDFLSRALYPLRDVSSSVRAVTMITKCKLTFGISSQPSLTRYFRLIVDETCIPGQKIAGKIRQVEIEYKGSNQSSADDVVAVKDEMAALSKIVEQTQGLHFTPTLQTKRNWAKKALENVDISTLPTAEELAADLNRNG